MSLRVVPEDLRRGRRCPGWQDGCRWPWWQRPWKNIEDTEWFDADHERMNTAIEAAAGGVIDHGDGTFGVEASAVPDGLASAYRGLLAYGYANGLLGVADGTGRGTHDRWFAANPLRVRCTSDTLAASFAPIEAVAA